MVRVPLHDQGMGVGWTNAHFVDDALDQGWGTYLLSRAA